VDPLGFFADVESPPWDFRLNEFLDRPRSLIFSDCLDHWSALHLGSPRMEAVPSREIVNKIIRAVKILSFVFRSDLGENRLHRTVLKETTVKKLRGRMKTSQIPEQVVIGRTA
jgi:hypothetical protein